MSSKQDFDAGDAQETPLGEGHLTAAMANEYGRGAARRVSDMDLLKALMDYRAEPENELLRTILWMVLHSSIQYAVNGHIYRKPVLKPCEDDLVQMTWVRLLRQEKKTGQLLADYKPGEGVTKKDETCSVYAWVWKNVSYAVLDQFRILNEARDAGCQFEISLSEFEPDEESMSEDVQMRRTPQELQISETPLRASFLRVTTLTPWLVTLASDMVGKQLTLTLKNGTAQRISFDRSHKDIWLHWLALKEASATTEKSDDLSNLDFNELSEAELSVELGISRATIQRHSDEAYAFMLQHKDFPKNLDLMIPNRVRGEGVSDQALRAGMLASLHSPKGKVMFRELVQVWLKTHYQ